MVWFCRRAACCRWRGKERAKRGRRGWEARWAECRRADLPPLTGASEALLVGGSDSLSIPTRHSVLQAGRQAGRHTGRRQVQLLKSTGPDQARQTCDTHLAHVTPPPDFKAPQPHGRRRGVPGRGGGPLAAALPLCSLLLGQLEQVAEGAPLRHDLRAAQVAPVHSAAQRARGPAVGGGCLGHALRPQLSGREHAASLHGGHH